jgi:hypothetical protein
VAGTEGGGQETPGALLRAATEMEWAFVLGRVGAFAWRRLDVRCGRSRVVPKPQGGRGEGRGGLIPHARAHDPLNACCAVRVGKDRVHAMRGSARPDGVSEGVLAMRVSYNALDAEAVRRMSVWLHSASCLTSLDLRCEEIP